MQLKFPRIPTREAIPVIGGIGGIVAPIATTAYYVASFAKGEPGDSVRAVLLLIVLATCSAVAGSIALVLWIASKRRFLETKVRFERIEGALQELNQILAIDYRYCTALEDAAGMSASDIEAKYEKYNEEMLAHVASIFSKYTGETCAASIKILSSSASTKLKIDPATQQAATGASAVFTLARDSVSRQARSHVDADGSHLALYAYSVNTAFHAVMHVEDLHGFYFANELSKKPHGEYQNSNRDWPKHYDSVAVACLKNPCLPKVNSAVGFLCVDSKAGRFDGGNCRQIMECIASIMYYSIRKTYAVLAEK